jgi:hypothetical protein
MGAISSGDEASALGVQGGTGQAEDGMAGKEGSTEETTLDIPPCGKHDLLPGLPFRSR